MNVLDISLRWLIVLAECGLLAQIFRTGTIVLLPGFTFYMVGSLVTMALFAAGHYTANINGQIAIFPLRAWAAVEAIRFRTRYIDDFTPSSFGSMGRWMIGSAAWFALAIGAVVIDVPVQFNVPQVSMHIRNTLNGGIAGAMLLAWTVIETKRLRSPIRATPHLALLTAWFIIYAGVNLVQIGPGEEMLWLKLAIGSNATGCLILAMWFRLFRPVPSEAPLLSGLSRTKHQQRPDDAPGSLSVDLEPHA